MDTSVGLPAATLPPKTRSEGVTKTTETSSTQTIPHLHRHVHWAVSRYILDSGNSAVTVYSVPRRTSVTTWEDAVSRSYEDYQRVD
ncbi:hypothetical protein ANCCAN_27436 [Ancylostoma caninum]|uniref:Uncharacterized protein n=1 Tax=Ancylostoma caninum TaxID=29170 RepID=A0A368F409_ANCCA|nr:hypothetical protein ANCCAN_27436 [Ancylostoma caninum]